jgi:hypothetical protein
MPWFWMAFGDEGWSGTINANDQDHAILLASLLLGKKVNHVAQIPYDADCLRYDLLGPGLPPEPEIT